MDKLSQFDVAPFQALINMLKTNYLDTPEIFRTVVALLCDYDSTDQNSVDMTSRYLRILLIQNSELAECLITYLQPKWASHAPENVPTSEKDLKSDSVQMTKKPPSCDPYVYNMPQTKLKQSPGSAFVRPTKMAASTSGGTSTVATLYPTLRSSLVRGSIARTAIPAQFSPFLYPAYLPMMGAPIAWMRRPHGCVQAGQLAGTEEALDLTQHSSSRSEHSESKDKDAAKSKVKETSSDEKTEKGSQKTAVDEVSTGDGFSSGLTYSANSTYQQSVGISSPAGYARVFYQNPSPTVGSNGIPYKIMDSSTEVFLGTARNLTSFPYLQRMILPDGQMKTISFDGDTSHQRQPIASEISLDQANHPTLRERTTTTVAKIKPKPVSELSSTSSNTSTTPTQSTAQNAEAKVNKAKKRPLRTIVQIGLKEKVKKLSAKSAGPSSKE